MTRLFLLFSLILFSSAGCSILKNSKPSLSDLLSSRAVRIEMPLIYQEDEKSCGVAVIDMLTRYYGVLLSDSLRKRVQNEVKSHQSVSGQTLKEVLEETGYRVAVFPGTLDYEPTGLYRHLEAERPLIVLFGLEESQIGHYSLVSGFDPVQGWIVITDSKKGEFATSTEDFLRYWERGERFTLLAEPKTDLFRHRPAEKKPLF